MATPIRIHTDNPRIFEFRGKPRMLVCATEHYGAVINRPFRFERYLAEAAEKSQTLTRLFLLFRELQSDRNPYSTCKPESPDYIAPFPRTGGGRALDGQPRYDLTRWNPEFFDRLHRFLSLASEHGIIVEVTLFSNTYAPAIWALNPLHHQNNINDPEEIPWPDYLTARHPRLFQRQREYARKIVEEINRYDNVIIEICNEPGGDFPGNPAYPACTEVNAWEKEIARLIRETEARLPNRHLISGQEAFSYDSMHQSADLTFSDMPTDIVNMHALANITYAGRRYNMGGFMTKELTLRAVRDFCLATRGENKPLNIDEDNAASQYKDFDGWTIHRKRAWMTLLSMCHYDYIDFSIINYCETGTPESQRHIRTWMKHLSEFVHSIELGKAKPLVDFLSRRPPHTIEGVLAIENQDYCIYLADERELADPGAGEPIDGPVSFALPQGRWRMACYSPSTGMYSPWMDIKEGGAVELQTPSFRHDLVIRVRR
ncbi:cellulase family glycosylhydrolase [bacterium]|nr:cellulase family glycosylhydrolase [bacterium]